MPQIFIQEGIFKIEKIDHYLILAFLPASIRLKASPLELNQNIQMAFLYMDLFRLLHIYLFIIKQS